MIDPRTEPAWDTFIAAHPAATVFHTAAWCRVLAETYGYRPQYVGAFDGQGQLQAAVPLMLVQSWLTSKRLVGLPFSDAVESRMRAWLDTNPPGKHGAHRYTLAEFGLDLAEVREAFRPYTERFGVRLEE